MFQQLLLHALLVLHPLLESDADRVGNRSDFVSPESDHAIGGDAAQLLVYRREGNAGTQRQRNEPADGLHIRHQGATGLAQTHEHLERLTFLVFRYRHIHFAHRSLDTTGGSAEQLGPGPSGTTLEVFALSFVQHLLRPAQLGLQLGNRRLEFRHALTTHLATALLLHHLLRRGSRREHLHVPTAVAIHRDALAVQRVRQLVDLTHVVLCCFIREVARLADGAVGMLLERRLHANVPLGRHVVRRHEHSLPCLRHFVEADVPRLPNALHQLVGIPAFSLGDLHEVVVHVGHQHARLIPHERHGKEWLDSRRASCDDRDRSRRRHRREIAVSQATHRTDALTCGISGARLVRTPNALFPLGEHATQQCQALALDLGLFVHKAHELAGQLDGVFGMVGNAELHEQVGPPHDSQPDATNAVCKFGDLRQRIPVRVDHVLEEMGAQMHDLPQRVPIQLTVFHKHADVDRS